MEEFIPNLSKHIEVMEAASPLTYERYTGDWRGATCGWNWDPARSTRIKFAEDVRLHNFYSMGHWMHSPAGVPAAVGTAWYIVREILKAFA